MNGERTVSEMDCSQLEIGTIECSICKGPIAMEEIYYTPCSHTFNLQCIVQWLEQSRTCPVCRKFLSRHLLRHLIVNTSNLITCTSIIKSYKDRADELKARIAHLENLKLNHEVQLELESKKVLDVMKENLSLKWENSRLKAIQTSQCAAPADRLRPRLAENTTSGTRDRAKRAEAMTNDTKREIAGERQKRLDVAKKLRDERARVSELKKELRASSAECKLFEQRISKLEKILQKDKKPSERETNQSGASTCIASRTRSKDPR